MPGGSGCIRAGRDLPLCAAPGRECAALPVRGARSESGKGGGGGRLCRGPAGTFRQGADRVFRYQETVSIPGTGYDRTVFRYSDWGLSVESSEERSRAGDHCGRASGVADSGLGGALRQAEGRGGCPGGTGQIHGILLLRGLCGPESGGRAGEEADGDRHGPAHAGDGDAPVFGAVRYGAGRRGGAQGGAEGLRRRPGGADRGAGEVHPCPGGGGVQHQFPQAAGGGALRHHEAPRGQEDQDRVFHGGGRAGEAFGGGPHRQGHPGIPPAYQAEVHLCGRAGRLHRGGQEDPHQLQPDHHGHGPHQLHGAQPPEHPHAHGAG